MNNLNSISFKKALYELGVKPGSIIYITGNLGNLGLPHNLSGEKIKGRNQILDFYLNGILDSIGTNGTIVFPTHSFNLIENKDTFDPNQTPTNYTLSEYLRKTLKAKRQLHPYSSLASYGKHSDKIISKNITKHPYGMDSPYKFLEENDCIFISLGLPARKSISAVHYCEFKAGVPYRYTKSFNQSIFFNDKESLEEFFLYVCYREVEIIRDKNIKIFSKNSIKKNLKVQSIGNSFIEGIPLNLFIAETLKIMLIDPYVWTRGIKTSTKIKPWLN